MPLPSEIRFEGRITTGNPTPPTAAPAEGCPQTQPESGADVSRAIAYGICTGAAVSQLLAKAPLKISVPVSLLLLSPIGMYGQFGLRRTNHYLCTAAKTVGAFLWKHRRPVSMFLGLSAAALFLQNMADNGKISVTQSNGTPGIILFPEKKSSQSR